MESRLMRAWRTIGAAVAAVLLAACATDAYRPQYLGSNHASVTASASRFASGATVARHLQERYDENFHYCTRFVGDPDPKPALLCSGVLMRATKRGPGFYVWNPNPSSPIRNGVSFSWLRRDSGFSNLVFNYANGFIILPHYYADSPTDGYTQLVALCAYPYDAATQGRTTGNFDGCGAYAAIAGTGPCQAQGIETANAWIARFGGKGFYGNQCGFRILPKTPKAYLAFEALGQIRSQQGSFGLQNEVMIGTWAQNDRNIPLEAFFYLAGSADGLSQAKQNQREFWSVTSRWVPIIRVSLPSGVGGSASFLFDDRDQDVPQP